MPKKNLIYFIFALLIIFSIYYAYNYYFIRYKLQEIQGNNFIVNCVNSIIEKDYKFINEYSKYDISNDLKNIKLSNQYIIFNDYIFGIWEIGETIIVFDNNTILSIRIKKPSGLNSNFELKSVGLAGGEYLNAKYDEYFNSKRKFEIIGSRRVY